MKSRTIVLLAAISASSILFCACERQAEQPESPPADAETIVKPMEEYRQQAEREITGETAEQELQRLQREIDADTE